MGQERYDVAVVGSGLGGLGAAALLSHWGYKTLVVEKLERIGGRCSTEEYEGFKLPTGALTIIYGGTELEQIYAEVGAPFEGIAVPRLFWRIAGKDYQMPPKGALVTLIDIVNKIEADRAKSTVTSGKGVDKEELMAAWRLLTKEPERGAGQTFERWLLHYTDNELLHGIFDWITTMMVPGRIYEVPAALPFAMLQRMKGFRELVVPLRGHMVNMGSLAKVVRANGNVWVNCPAKQILVADKEAKGLVVQKDGHEIEIASQVVISDAGPKATVALAGEDNFDEAYLTTMRVGLKSASATMCFVASDRPLWPEDGSPATLNIVGARRVISAIPLSNISPHYAPPGQHLMFAFACAVSNHVHMDLEEEKRQCLLDLGELFPLFEKHGRVLKWVFRDFGDEFPFQRSRTGEGMPCETPIRKLYNVGDGVTAPGCNGSVAATESGWRVAEIVRKSFKPREA